MKDFSPITIIPSSIAILIWISSCVPLYKMSRAQDKIDRCTTPVPATVTNSGLTYDKFPRIVYRYSYQSVVYLNEENIGPGIYRRAKELVDRHPVGTEVTAYVNPSKPTEATVTRKIDKLPAVFAIPFAVGGGLAWLCIPLVRYQFTGRLPFEESRPVYLIYSTHNLGIHLALAMGISAGLLAATVGVAMGGGLYMCGTIATGISGTIVLLAQGWNGRFPAVGRINYSPIGAEAEAICFEVAMVNRLDAPYVRSEVSLLCRSDTDRGTVEVQWQYDAQVVVDHPVRRHEHLNLGISIPVDSTAKNILRSGGGDWCLRIVLDVERSVSKHIFRLPGFSQFDGV